MDAAVAAVNSNVPKSGSGFSIFTVLFLIFGIALIYYAYRYLYSPENVLLTVLVPGKIQAPPTKLPDFPTPLEGGEYTFTGWVYINSMNKNLGRRKHIFEIRGNAFSTLLVGLGAFKNSLVVRVHTKDPMQTAATAGAPAPSPGAGTAGPNAMDARSDGSLMKSDMDTLFSPLSSDDSLLTSSPICDMPEIDLQRWVMVSVVLSGRTIDVYLDGKLARSCAAKSYYRVDPTGSQVVLMDRGGFDGWMSGVAVANYAMNPGEIYRMYSAGPTGLTSNFASWLIGLLRPETSS